MPPIKLVCIDMFQTLVDINSRKEFIWKKLLKQNYTQSLGEKFSLQFSELIAKKYHDIIFHSSQFVTLREIFEKLLQQLDISEYLTLSRREASEVFIEEHNKAEAFKDSMEFFRLVSPKYDICLISDSDVDMITNHLKRFSFTKAYISEEVGSYKNHKSGKIFREALQHFNIKADEVIHIGDSPSDILGAHRVEIRSCWLNRHKSAWNNSIKPDYEVRSLLEAAEIILS